MSFIVIIKGNTVSTILSILLLVHCLSSQLERELQEDLGPCPTSLLLLVSPKHSASPTVHTAQLLTE